MTIRPETRARARALQVLYAWETDGRPSLDALLPGLTRLTRPGPMVLEMAVTLASGVIDRCDLLDETYAESARNWRLERLAVVDRNILRLAVSELLDQRVPPKVAIDEALWLAHRFGSPQSAAFVNGVLDAVARSLGRL